MIPSLKSADDQVMDTKHDLDSFLSDFNRRKLAMQVAIRDLGQHPERNEGSLDGLVQDLTELMKDVNNVQSILPSFTSKMIQSSLSSLSNDLDEVKKLIKPRKKFTFGRDLKKTNQDKEKASETVAEPFTPLVSQVSSHGLRERENEKLVVQGEINGKDYQLFNLKKCEISLQGNPSSLFIKSLEGCRVNSGPVTTSIFIEDCHDCVFHLFSQQLRIHSSSKCNLYTMTSADPIIEDCKGLRFGHFNYTYEGIEADFIASGLDYKKEKEIKVIDFNWLSNHEPSPNYSIDL